MRLSKELGTRAHGITFSLEERKSDHFSQNDPFLFMVEFLKRGGVRVGLFLSETDCHMRIWTYICHEMTPEYCVFMILSNIYPCNDPGS